MSYGPSGTSSVLSRTRTPSAELQFGFGQKKVTTNSLPDNFSFQEILTYSCSTDIKLHVNGVFSAETYSWEKVRLNIESSVTRLRNYFPNIGPLIIMKICPMATKSPKVGSKLFAKYKINPVKITKLFKNLAKVAKFCQV